jgi:hypothetical protein
MRTSYACFWAEHSRQAKSTVKQQSAHEEGNFHPKTGPG